jgi:hypothetical protein
MSGALLKKEIERARESARVRVVEEDDDEVEEGGKSNTITRGGRKDHVFKSTLRPDGLD